MALPAARPHGAGLSGIRRLLFIRTDRLGEVVLNLPALAALRRALPKARITAAVTPQLRQLLQGSPAIDEFLEYQDDPCAPWWLAAVRLAGRLRPERFDAAVISNPKREFHVATWLAGIPIRIGYDRKWGWTLTHRRPDLKALGDRHEVEQNVTLVEPLLGGAGHAIDWPLPPLEPEACDVEALLGARGIALGARFIAVHPWTSNPLKRWPPERFEALIRMINARLSVPAVLIGGEDERRCAAEIGADRWPAVDLTGQLTLRQLAVLLRRARLVVSNDSGPVHVASAVGTPAVVLFGTAEPATGPDRWGPRGPGHAVIRGSAMEAITVDDVFEAVAARLT